VYKSVLIRALSGTEVAPEILVPDQDVEDIIRGLKFKHKACQADYDMIAGYFYQEGDDIETLCYNLWEFLKTNLRYKEETVKDQRVTTPIQILRRGWSDCKCYSLFIAGVLDSLRRDGYDVTWTFRLVPSSILQTSVGHVFVVVNPLDENIWVDPVLPDFDAHNFYLIKRDMPVQTPSAIGKVSGFSTTRKPGRIGSAYTDLLANIAAYAQGTVSAINTSQSTGVLNTLSLGVLKSATSAVPGISQALAAVSAAQSLINNAFGPGSKAALLFADLNNNIFTMPIAIVNTLFNGRTFQSDQYYGAQLYQLYVLGKPVYDQNAIADSDVAPALKFWMDRLGIYISGRESIIAISQGVAQYNALYAGSNQAYTTDQTALNYAYQVASRYFKFTNVPGSWSAIVGVYDPALVAIANAMGESVEQAAAQVKSGLIQNVPIYAAPTPATAGAATFLASPIPWLVAAALAAFLIFEN
jgi:hypothetical protein